MIKVWSILIRALHWSLVISVVAAWLTREGFADNRHIWLGYACIGIIVARVGWGFFGARRDRFNSFVAPPTPVKSFSMPSHATWVTIPWEVG
jgi:cytochrome b